MIEIVAYSETKSLWFKNGKLIENPDNPPYSSHKKCKTIKKARKITRGILNKFPDSEVHILRWSWKNGIRYVEEEIWKNR